MRRAKIRLTIAWYMSLFAAMVFAAVSCGKTSFMSAGKTKNASEDPAPAATDSGSETTTDTATATSSDVNTGDVAGGSGTTSTKTEIHITPLKDTDFLMVPAKDMLAAQKESRFWVVTRVWPPPSTSHIYYFVMRDKKIISQKAWTFATLNSQTGARTYVTEGGLVFGVTGGFLFWIDPLSTPEGEISETVSATNRNFFAFPDTDPAPNYVPPARSFGGGDRVCVVSYRRGAKRFLGMGYGAGNFIEMEMDSTPPYAPKFAITRALKSVIASGSWGYSCAIDQNRLIYYSKYLNMGALDLNTMTALDYTKASTNHDVSALSATYKNVVDSTAYAIFGDRKGNLFGRYNSHSTAGYYTLTHDMVSNYVFAFKYGGYIMGVYPHDCLTTNTSCVYDNSNPAGGLVFSQYNTGDPKINAQIGKAVGTIGPVSALKAGGFIGVTRGSAAQVLYFEVTDNDLSKGIDVTSLDASITGDPYMYTDFTGATLYDTGSTISTFAFKDQSSFDATKPVHYVAFNWTAVAGSSTSWSRMTLEARCYAGTDGSATDFTTVDIVKDAGLNTFLGVVPSCREKLVDHMDLRIIKLDTTPSAPSIGNISVGFYQ